MSQTIYEVKDVIGIAGTGLMGRGIAQIAVQAGIPVVLYDNRPGASMDAKEAIVAMLEKLAAKGKLTADAVAQAADRLVTAEAISELSPCTLVVEAIVEDLEVKQALFRELEGIVSESCILATNTSSLSVTAIAAACQRPSRVGGFHFFSPVPLMKIVEVIGGPLTDSSVVDKLVDLARSMGHTPVRASDTPGFIVNHAGRGYLTESLRLLGERVASHTEIDKILRLTVGFRMGPFELLDLTGLDVSQPVMESIYDQYYQEPRFRPSPIARQRLAAGLLGRKTQRGFYSYIEGQKERFTEASVPQAEMLPIWISRSDRKAFPNVVSLLKTLGAELDTGMIPLEDSLCLLLPVGEDVTTVVAKAMLDPVRCVGLDPIFFGGCRTLMTNPVTSSRYRDSAYAMFAADGTPVTVIHDSPGFVAQRVIATIVNIGSDIAQQGIATPQDIDHAVTLGLGYPLGPLSMGDKYGAKTIMRILDGLFEFYRDPRYRPSPWLKRRALLEISLLTPEN